MNSVAFLDAVRDRHGLDSDNKLAAFLDINRGRVSLYRTGARTLAPVDCHKVARALDARPEYVLACVQAERAKRSEDRAAWNRLAMLAKKAGAAPAAVLVALSAGLLPYQAKAANVLCILCKVRPVGLPRPIDRGDAPLPA